ncbi:ABC transporter permease [Rhizobium rhizogenes]|uniref:ABC transporter permease n=1 Tax=Rhizobium rhizogenes TaxID=359 RepID=UPI0004D55BD0|nr:ABC transporter permease [Rhizobium rhizogenes]KEA04737.1 ABC transporter [Rhizobium rhizogenes]MQB33799.1 ABC transporter permease [Rhizobium rhizogenes]NTI43440.1 ABC transporter permease [Rhizobium rhizogenes]NTI82668.1 ABC transporter permease [Rhizobium rhizogenes]NTJ24850.1 ABC transporter permease [Rhizobium rhizogenes]
MLKSLWQYRHFIASSIRGDLKGRFARSYFGGFWFILHPLAQALIFSIVLAEVMRARMPNIDSPAAYPIYLLSGMAAWGLFSEILNRSMGIFIEQAHAMKKIAFPRLCLPIIVWGSALINHVLLLVAIAVIFLFFGHFPGLAWIYLIPGMALISAMAFGIGVFLGVLNVFARDIAQVMSVVLQLWFWFTPIVYAKNVLPEKFHAIVDLNPLTTLVGIYQNALLLDQAPSIASLIPSAVIGVVVVMASFLLFRRASPELVDAL